MPHLAAASQALEAEFNALTVQLKELPLAISERELATANRTLLELAAKNAVMDHSDFQNTTSMAALNASALEQRDLAQLEPSSAMKFQFSLPTKNIVSH
jgi:hypothetical protein